MNIGFKFKNNGNDYTVVQYAENDKHNVALIERKGTPCPYITVKDLMKMRDGDYCWFWGHYYKTYKEALTDYNKRKKDYEI